MLLRDIFDDRPGAKRVDVIGNWIHDNNKDNTARPGSILSFIPRGIGVLNLGVDDSVVSNNLIEGNEYVGVAIADYCVVVDPTPFGCFIDPDTLTPGFVLDQTAQNNRVENNVLLNNATQPPPSPPFPPEFQLFTSDFALLTLPWELPSPPFPPPTPEDLDPYHNNCYVGNDPADPVFFSLYNFLAGIPQVPPPCL